MRYLLLAFWLVCAALSDAALAREPSAGTFADTVARAELPGEAQQTLQLIERGGPFPYRRDGIVFGNLEKRLPAKVRGYYHEYTVPTPGSPGHSSRGARRIVAGKVGESYYSDDHYRSFRRIRE